MYLLKLFRNALIILALFILFAPGCKSEDSLTVGDKYLSEGNSVKASFFYMKALAEGESKEIIKDRMNRIAIVEKKDSLYISSAEELMKQGDYLSAESELKKAIEIDKYNNNTKLLLAETYVKLSKFKDAKVVIDQLLLDSEKSPEIYYLLSKYYYNRGNYMETCKYLELSLKLDKNYKSAKNFLVSVKREIAKIDNSVRKEARGYFKDGIRAIYAGSYKKAYELLTISLSEYMPEKDGELDNLQEVGELIMEDYSLISLYSNLILTAKKIGKFEEVLSYLVSINELVGHSAEIYYKIGKVYEHNGYWKQANYEYKKALSMNSKLPGLRSSMGYVYKKLGKYDDSVSEFETALKNDPQNPVLMYNLGIMYKKVEKLKEARSKLSEVKKFLKPGTKFYYTVEEHLANLK